MARLVKKSTFLYEEASPGVLVRRQVFAGQMVPDHYVDGEDTASGAFEDVDGPPKFGLGAAPSDYKHNLVGKGRQGGRRAKPSLDPDENTEAADE